MRACRLLSGGVSNAFPRSSFRKLSGCTYKPFEEGARKIIALPTQLGMPLHSNYKPIAARIFDCLDQAVRRPRRRHQFPSQLFHGLMMMAVDRRPIGPGKLAHQAVFDQAHLMRVAITRSSLLVFNCF